MGLFIKKVELLLLPEDEVDLAAAIRAQFPRVLFVDNRRWSRLDVPPAYDSIADCGRIAAIWNRAISPTLPAVVRDNGVIDGPQTGPVVQWLRSYVDEDAILQAGRWAASNDPASDGPMIEFVKEIWKILTKKTTNKLRRAGAIGGPVTPSVSERQFRVGRRALDAVAQGKLILASNRMRLIPE